MYGVNRSEKMTGSRSDMCSDKTMDMSLSSLVGKSSTLCDPLSTTSDTHGPFKTLPLLYFLLAPNFFSFISMVFPKPLSVIPAFKTLLEQIALHLLRAQITVGKSCNYLHSLEEHQMQPGIRQDIRSLEEGA